MVFKPDLLVTGVTGFIGGALAARLVQTGRWSKTLFLIRAQNREDGLARLAYVLGRHEVPERFLRHICLEQILCGDLSNVDEWRNDPRLESVNDVVNLAAVASFGNHPSIWPTNVDGVLKMAHALTESCELRRFLHVGTGMACGDGAPNPVPEGYDAGDDTIHFLEYTASKYEVERRLREELPDLPLIIARPSIVVGHTRLGCQPSGSIYWVFRMARALQAFPCELKQRIDVVPVDYCAEALHMLLEKPELKHTHYHISSGIHRSCSFGEIDAGIAKALDGKPMQHYRALPFEEFPKMKNKFKELIGPCNPRIVLKAIHAYGNFAAKGMLFDNSNLLAEGLGLPRPLASYAGLCEKTSKGFLISEQMKFDYK